MLKNVLSIFLTRWEKFGDHTFLNYLIFSLSIFHEQPNKNFYLFIIFPFFLLLFIFIFFSLNFQGPNVARGDLLCLLESNF